MCNFSGHNCKARPVFRLEGLKETKGLPLEGGGEASLSKSDIGKGDKQEREEDPS